MLRVDGDAVDGFVGRARELAALRRQLDRVREGGRTGRPGRALLMRGRRRVGKSRLVEEFAGRSGVPHLYFTASAQPSVEADLRLFVEAARESDLPGAGLFTDQTPGSWDAALRLLATALPADGPSIVVLDEMPYLMATDPGFEGTLQKLFDRELSRLPVLLVCIGSDLAMMEALNEYGRPFHQRATEMVVPPLNPAEVGRMLGVRAAEAVDAYLVSGGLPLVLDEWRDGAGVLDYLAAAVADPTSALVVSGERALAAEFPPDSQARLVLGAIGAGERTYTRIALAAGEIPKASLTRALNLLATKRVVASALPLSTQPSRETRYAVADPHLRFWLAFVGPHLPEIERGRGDLVLARIRSGWTTWRGRAVEPLVREALHRLPSGELPGSPAVVGGYWTRTNDVEIDLVGADREPVAKQITMVGSIKWLEQRPFDVHDLGELVAHRRRLPGADAQTPLLAVSRVVGNLPGIRTLGPEDLLAAYD
ncbi:ATP-binding protein [Catellatospora tritici]|uniref:ATP-binding protein n=1 Tax=Catellatospora tritici TaxID=2851566 RepID=UPI001C2D72F0|nr:ATP-binding protein [Catellatospora tritici]MBV1851482.1 ATP-binding protein [Catellatospora tritici]